MIAQVRYGVLHYNAAPSNLDTIAACASKQGGGGES